MISEIYFYPVGFTDDSYIGTPLNKAATKSLKRDHMTPSVPYLLKRSAGLSTAKDIGLRGRDEQLNIIKVA